MNLKQSLGRDKKWQDEELNITPVMNIFLILVPFLLLTAVFVKISILEFSLPSAENLATLAGQNAPIVTILAITDNGFELRTKGKSIPFIAKRNDEFNYSLLVARLKEIKLLHRQTEDIIIAPQATVKYQVLIKVMDSCRENGFPNISISA